MRKLELALISLLAGVGCRKQVEPPPAPSTVVSLTTRDPRLEGASVVLEGQRETIHGQGEYYASFEVPKTLPPGPPALEVDVYTACGALRVPVTLTIEMDAGPTSYSRSGRKEIKLSLAAAGLPAALTGDAVEVLVDSAAPVQLGQLALKPGKQHVSGLGCAAKHDVMIAGKVVGQVEASSDAPNSVFITAEPAACYRYETVAYGDDAGATTVLRGSQVYRTGHVDYFLMEAPRSMRVGSPGGTTRVNALNEVPCP